VPASIFKGTLTGNVPSLYEKNVDKDERG